MLFGATNGDEGPVQIIERYKCVKCGAIQDMVQNRCPGDSICGNMHPYTNNLYWHSVGKLWFCGKHDIEVFVDGEPFDLADYTLYRDGKVFADIDKGAICDYYRET